MSKQDKVVVILIVFSAALAGSSCGFAIRWIAEALA